MIQFSGIDVGMSEATVQARVGTPDTVVDRGTAQLGRGGFGTRVVREIHRYTWVYYGASTGEGRILDSHIHFADGVVISKEQVAR
jgi:hypothetical protein